MFSSLPLYTLHRVCTRRHFMLYFIGYFTSHFAKQFNSFTLTIEFDGNFLSLSTFTDTFFVNLMCISARWTNHILRIDRFTIIEYLSRFSIARCITFPHNVHFLTSEWERHIYGSYNLFLLIATRMSIKSQCVCHCAFYHSQYLFTILV